MFDILTLIPGRKKHTPKGWYTFDAVCCHHFGHKPDERGRGGILLDGANNWRYHCFNCNFKCGFTLGKTITNNTRNLLTWCGVDKSDIDAWNLYSLRNRDLLDFTHTKKTKIKVKFKEIALPKTAELIDTNNVKHHKFIEYLAKRGFAHDEYPFMVSPSDLGRNTNRIIIPYTFNGKIVGYTSRFLDDRTPKYIKEQQLGYIFGYDFQKPEYEVCIVVEGIFDALSINACALTHDTISDEQADLLRSLHKRIIVVPDRDKTGMTICEKALDLGFQVSLPDWSEDTKDTNDAVVKYGKLPTLLSILESATNSKIKIEMMRRKIVKRL